MAGQPTHVLRKKGLLVGDGFKGNRWLINKPLIKWRLFLLGGYVTWRIIPISKWLITMVNKSPK